MSEANEQESKPNRRRISGLKRATGAWQQFQCAAAIQVERETWLAEGALEDALRAASAGEQMWAQEEDSKKVMAEEQSQKHRWDVRERLY